SHPTPPVFDGPEDRNGLRNADEIRFWRYYIDGEPFRDDQERVGGLAGDSAFIIAGDLNADPLDGASTGQPAGALLDHPRIRATPAPRSAGAVEKALADGGVNRTHRSQAATDTADFGDGQAGNLRVDYVLPSTNLDVLGAGVFWPDAEAPGAAWIDASDHRLVWIDVGCAPRGSAMAAGASYNPRSQE
ncbi:MAG: endonuclease/exonuclease/phosphatase family protein, partial [Pseudomonadota bacterium]